MTDSRQNAAPFFAKNADAIKWLMILFVLRAIVGQFYENQGFWHIASSEARALIATIAFALSMFIIFRLVKRRGSDDLKALMVFMLLPSQNNCVSSLFELVIIFSFVMFRLGLPNIPWVIGLLCIGAFCGIRMPALFTYDSPPPNPVNGTFVSSIDGIYNLYKFDGPYAPNFYDFVLYREVKVFPGVSLAKSIDHVRSPDGVAAARTPDGNYVIVDGVPPLPSR